MTDDQTVTQALEPCPFCGNRDLFVSATLAGGVEWHMVECRNQECDIGGPPCKTEAEAITAWNTRPPHSGEGRSNGAGEDAADNFRECVAAELAPARDWYAKGQNHEGVLIYLLTNVMADLQSYRSGTYRSGGGAIAVGEVDPEELEDVIDDAISDSFDEEWTSRHGARHAVGAIAHEGWVVAPRAALAQPEAGGE